MAGKIGVAGLSDDEQGFYLGCQLAVHQCELEFIFKIGKSPESADNDPALFLAEKVDEKPGK